MNFLCLDFRPFGSRNLKPEISVPGTTAPFIYRRIQQDKLKIEDSLFSPTQEKFFKFTGQVFLLFSEDELQSLSEDFLARFQRSYKEKIFLICTEANLPQEAFENSFEEEEEANSSSSSRERKIQVPFKLLLPSMITDNNIYIGDMYHAKSLETLQKLGITHVINVTKDVPCFFINDFEYCCVPVDDVLTENIVAVLFDAIKFMFSSLKSYPNAKIFVHCAAGVSRSPAIVIGYLMWRDKISFDDAFLKVHSQRSCIDPNFAFCSQLTMEQERIHSFNF